MWHEGHNISFPPSGEYVPLLTLTRRCVDEVTLGVPYVRCRNAEQVITYAKEKLASSTCQETLHRSITIQFTGKVNHTKKGWKKVSTKA